LGGSSDADLSSKKINEDDSKKVGEPKKRLFEGKKQDFLNKTNNKKGQ
jgi:hypothetical protein